MCGPSLEVFKDRLEAALSSLIQWKITAPMVQELEPHVFYGLFQNKPFYDKNWNSAIFSTLGIEKRTSFLPNASQ